MVPPLPKILSWEFRGCTLHAQLNTSRSCAFTTGSGGLNRFYNFRYHFKIGDDYAMATQN